MGGTGKRDITNYLLVMSLFLESEAWHLEIQKSVKDRLAAIADAAMNNIANAVRLKADLHASKFVVKHLLARKEK